jgi:hypothetical protein
VLLPEHLPSGDGRSVSADELREFTDTARRRTLSHGSDQDDDGSKVDLATQKAHRGWRRPASAAVLIAAEAKPSKILVWKGVRAASRLSRIVGAMKTTTASTPCSSRLFGKVSVD